MISIPKIKLTPANQLEKYIISKRNYKTLRLLQQHLCLDQNR